MATVQRTDGGTIDYELIDLVDPWVQSPETIIFHHGMGIRREAWHSWLPALIGRYRVILFDIRGHGQSSPHDAKSALTLDCLADDLFAVSDAEKVERFHFVGESLGGTVGLYLGIHSAARIESIIFTNAPHQGRRLENVGRFQEYLQSGGMASWSRFMMTARFPGNHGDSAMLSWYEREQAAIQPEMVLLVRDLLRNTDLTDQLEEISAPVLLLNGDSSPFISPLTIADLHTRLPNAQLRIVANAGHGLPVSHASECSNYTFEFLQHLKSS